MVKQRKTLAVVAQSCISTCVSNYGLIIISRSVASLDSCELITDNCRALPNSLKMDINPKLLPRKITREIDFSVRNNNSTTRTRLLRTYCDVMKLYK